ncbi:hypothetical protein E2P67_05375 [Xanthomonas perforans]|nr:hypothetical protein EIJ44_12435 [Xanthomonas perforans]TQT14436.1 hypothetical protein EIJ11_14520 [Xanthomonas perforans]TQT21705.1 hypothetical protein EIJ05_00920 [Xanthomonas perforans]TQT24361.1 hypothetical protein EIJ02_12350 [Xanthomonas perforans]TQT31097.1 hypothetical protein EIJ04_08350 [Xanthomonas perforans]
MSLVEPLDAGRDALRSQPWETQRPARRLSHRRGILGGMNAAKEPQRRTCSVSCDGGRARAV